MHIAYTVDEYYVIIFQIGFKKYCSCRNSDGMASAIQDLTIIIHFFIPLFLERGECMLYAAEIFECMLYAAEIFEVLLLNFLKFCC